LDKWKFPWRRCAFFSKELNFYFIVYIYKSWGKNAPLWVLKSFMELTFHYTLTS
jgi:hypothetical protein